MQITSASAELGSKAQPSINIKRKTAQNMPGDKLKDQNNILKRPSKCQEDNFSYIN